ncbi:MAG: NAD(P)/FAD-dependent oxidoreductase [Rhizobiales bacterium]|nr:NAD(P)/FAD-dependent oxidoreductase [Hyphomicrobiales bacterium]
MKKSVVVLGAGIGGTSAAFEIKEQLGDRANITVVSDSEWFHFVPSNPWVALKWREAKDIKVHLPEIFANLKIGFNASGAKRVLPDQNTLLLNDGTRLTYDYLVIATGPALAFDEIEGFGPGKNSNSICHVDHASALATKWDQFCADPGPIVVGAVQGASCFGPAYEFALLANTDLRRRKIRHRVPITFVTSEPYIGHLGLGGVGDTKGLLESVLRNRDIKWITNARVDHFDDDKVVVSEMNEDGSVKKVHELPSRLNMMIPGFKGVSCFFDEEGKPIEGLVNPRGFVLIDKFQANPTYPNVYGVGVCVAIPPVEKTPVPVGVPKTGYMIESMVSAVAANLSKALAGHKPETEATWNAVCLADFGDDGVAFVALPQIPPRNVNWAGQGYWVHLAKVAFEKYFMHKVRTGAGEPGYERVVMKMLGVERTRRD